METGVIKYNLNERKRSLTGQDRQFDVKKVAGFINSQKFQESVKHRDVFGYFGHWVRQKFGLKPNEVVVDKGQLIPIEPAIVTTEIKAYNNGDIEHKVRFLDTPTGKIAKSMYESQTGGFSSVIDPMTGEFYGFDFVNSPNYSTNRGYQFAFDSVNDKTVFDDVLDSLDSSMRYAQELEAMNAELAISGLKSATALSDVQAKLFDAVQSKSGLQARITELENLLKEKDIALDSAHQMRSRGAEKARVLFDGVQAFYNTINEHGDALHKDKPRDLGVVDDGLISRLFKGR